MFCFYLLFSPLQYLALSNTKTEALDLKIIACNDSTDTNNSSPKRYLICLVVVQHVSFFFTDVKCSQSSLIIMKISVITVKGICLVP